MMQRHSLTDGELSSLSNICRTAAERFAEHAKTFRDMIDAPPPQPGAIFAPRGEQARRLAEQFERQQREAMDFAGMFDLADEVSVHDIEGSLALAGERGSSS